jgi:uncharacterized protein YqgC (DUF456 family)
MNPVSWFFIVGGSMFLLAALFLREMGGGQAADSVALTFGLIGFFWLAPQLVIWFVRRGK